MFLGLLNTLGLVLGLVFAWCLVGVVTGILTLLIKASFQGKRFWQYVKEVIVIAPDAWFNSFVELGPGSFLIIPFMLIGRFDPRQERDLVDQKEFCRTTGLKMEQWVTHGHRDANELSAVQSLEHFDVRVADIKRDFQELPERATYWARVGATWTRRYAWATAMCAFIIASVRGGIASATEVADSSSSEVAEKVSDPVMSLGGYAAMDLRSIRQGQEVVLKFLRFKPVYTNGDWYLKAEVDVNGSTKAKNAFIGYDSPELQMQIEAGRIITAYAWNFTPPNKSEFNRTPLDDELGVPLFDNGIIVSKDVAVLGHGFNLKAAATNGSGDYADNNAAMDASIRIASETPLGSFGLTAQIGDQPDGFRELYLASYHVTLGPVTLRCLGMERPDIDGEGFMTSLVTRAGPWSFSAQYDQSRYGSVTHRFCDAGVNLMCGDNTTLKARTLLSSDGSPEYCFRLVQLF